jgi:5-methylcytosine-specific restriction endonuclease McrA
MLLKPTATQLRMELANTKNAERARNYHTERHLHSPNSEPRKVDDIPNEALIATLKSQYSICVLCPTYIEDSFYLDHILSLNQGGGHTLDNIQFLCKRCSSRKGYQQGRPSNRPRVSYLEKTSDDEALLKRLREDGTWPDYE